MTVGELSTELLKFPPDSLVLTTYGASLTDVLEVRVESVVSVGEFWDYPWKPGQESTSAVVIG